MSATDVEDIFPFSYGLIVKQGRSTLLSYTVDHTVVDTAVLIDIQLQLYTYMLIARVYSSNQCPPPTVYDSGAVFSPTVLDISVMMISLDTLLRYGSRC